MTLLRYVKLPALLALLLFTACMHPISKQTREQVAEQTTFTMVKAAPDAFINQQLLLGGVIVSMEEDGDETLLEIILWHLNRWGEPTSMSEEEQRFLVKTKQLLDQKTFEPGVLVTLAGAVLGQENRLLGEHDYNYPVLELTEIHAWQSPFRYGIHRVYTPDYPYYVGRPGYSNRNPYDPSYSIYPYTQYWYGPAVYQSRE